ncbi:amidohydrolase [Amylibacter kogurei]|uniref:Amidohydrolase n=1 Tax=Paramylibacter kogurei TaxID=1889778 RepID=A0A2G5K9V9_9RHOB|nr:M20 aminoacylase family protein [Amylibacter kogurei]PIB25949.1 amidohydrolase [Amylibacter kogurei]
MPVINRIADYFDEMKGWRQHIHTNPEVGFECHETAAFVADRLREFGVDDISTGWAKTGVVAVINGKGDGGTIALRADMDALPMPEETGLEYASQNAGKMHACGHDGHTTMLLGAAKYLAETRNFSGRVVLIFQPAEEGGGGAGVMVDEGLVEKYEIDQTYALHNLPNLPIGQFETTRGPIMAAADDFSIEISGRGGHAAYPHGTIDPIIVATQMVQAFQSIVSRNVDPIDTAVLTITQIHAGTTTNVIPETARLVGTVRTFKSEVKDMIKSRMETIMHNTADAFGASVSMKYNDGYPATVNHAEEADFAASVAAGIVGDDKVTSDVPPSMGAEDFAYFLQKSKGAYLFVGNGPSAGLHHTKYNFNDEAAPYGATFFARLVETAQPV